MNDGRQGRGGRPTAPWELTTPVTRDSPDDSISHRGFFWIGWAVGVLNALACVAGVMLFKHWLS